MLYVKDLSFSYGEKNTLNGLSFGLKQGEIGCLIGASGSGKSTIFKLLTGLLRPTSGTIAIAGMFLPESRSHVSYMMQEDLLLPWRSVLSNLLLTSELGKNVLSKEKMVEEAKRLLVEVGLVGCEDLFPEQLSGGMRQRVSLARALLQNRPLLLLDEPFGSLDVSLREQMYVFLRQIQAKYGTTLLMVTHDFRDAVSLADHVFLLAHKRIYKEWSLSDQVRKDPAQTEKLMNEMRIALQEALPLEEKGNLHQTSHFKPV